MIQAVLIFNNKGLPRLTKFYSTTPTPHLQQLLIAEIFSLVSKRPPGSCNFLEGSQMLGGDDVRIIYRHYATLYFVFVVEESESELGILDLIQVPYSFYCANGQVFVESLDRSFPNVCELDLVRLPRETCLTSRFSIFRNVMLFCQKWFLDRDLCWRRILIKFPMQSTRGKNGNDQLNPWEEELLVVGHSFRQCILNVLRQFIV
jgi:hypothetical protein